MEEISYLLASAAIGGFVITAVSGKFMIPALHRLHFGQTVREEGPTWHNKKNGTPTMGGLCFIFGILVTLGLTLPSISDAELEAIGAAAPPGSTVRVASSAGSPARQVFFNEFLANSEPEPTAA